MLHIYIYDISNLRVKKRGQCARERQRVLLYVCKKECVREMWNKPFLSSCTSFVNFFFFGGGSSFCHSPRLNFFSPNCHCQFFLSLFTSQYELSDQADYKSKPKFVVPPLRLQNHNFQALFVLFHFSCCLSSALLVFTLPLSSALLSSFQYALLLP